MKNNWPRVKLNKILQERKESPNPIHIASGDIKIISKIGFESGKIEFRQNSSTHTKMISIHPGDLVISGINASKGAIAIMDSSFKASATIHYSSYAVNENLADRFFLWLYFRSAYFQEILTSQLRNGIKTELKANRFLQVEAPLPPIKDQHKIIKKITSHEQALQASFRISEKQIDELEVLKRSLIMYLIGNIKSYSTLNNILSSKPRNGWSAKCDNLPGGTPVLSLSAVTGYSYKSYEHKLTSLATTPNGNYWLVDNDLLITRSNTPDLVGHAAIYSGEPRPCIYPDLMMRLDVNEHMADKQFVWIWLQSPIVREFVKKNAKGTSPTMKKISQTIVMDIPWPTGINLAKQRDIVRDFKTSSSKIDLIIKSRQKLDTNYAAYFESLKSSIFKGELT